MWCRRSAGKKRLLMQSIMRQHVITKQTKEKNDLDKSEI